MDDSLDVVERRLIAGYQRQATEYERALRVLEAGADAGRENNWAQHLNDVLLIVAELDGELTDAKAAWRDSGRTPGTELRALLDRLASQIRVVGAHIDAQVVQLVARKQRLLPEIDDFIRQRWMLHAYRQTGVSASS